MTFLLEVNLKVLISVAGYSVCGLARFPSINIMSSGFFISYFPVYLLSLTS